MGRPSYKAIAHLPFAQRLAELRKPEFRRASCRRRSRAAGASAASTAGIACSRSAIRRTTSPSPRAAIAARAAREGRTPEEVAYDLLLQRDGREMLYLPVTNFAAGNLDVVREMIAAPNT